MPSPGEPSKRRAGTESTALQAGCLLPEPPRKPAKAVLIDKKGIRSQTLEEKSKREYEGPECFFFFLRTQNWKHN